MAEIRSARTTVALFALLPALLLLPFAGKPFNIDDTLFVRSARQILVDPMRPYDFAVNWETQSTPMWGMTANPPLVAYVLAAAFALGGESEAAAHLALLPFAMASSALAYWLARRYTARPAAAAALFVLSPAFLVCAGSAMSDVPSLAFALGALALAHDDRSAPSLGRSLLCGAFLGLASVAKYQALVLIVVVGAIYAAQRRSRASWAALFAGFAAPSVAWAAVGLATHGSAHLIDTFSRGGRQGLDPWPFLRRATAATTFSVIALVSPLLVVPAVAARRRATSLAAIAALVALVVTAVLYKLGKPRYLELAYLTPGSALFVAAGVAVGVLGALMLARRIVRDRRARSEAAAIRGGRARLADIEWLAIWGFIIPAYVVAGAYWVAVRYLLPSLCAVAFLQVIAIDRAFASERARRRIVGAAIALTAAAGIAVSMAEDRFARFYRDGVAEALALVPAGSRVVFDGHWGFQHYLERAGVKPVEFGVDELEAGDHLLASEQTRSLDIAEYPGVFTLVKLIEAPPGPPIVTMRRRANAGFHADVYGLLPFVFSTQSPDRIAVFRVNDRLGG